MYSSSLSEPTGVSNCCLKALIRPCEEAFLKMYILYGHLLKEGITIVNRGGVKHMCGPVEFQCPIG